MAQEQKGFSDIDILTSIADALRKLILEQRQTLVKQQSRK
ncbi:hypothetical protein KDW_20440 [Dictyobacter vulcani]|uniref:Uncharacterized protein n=1 Tax=Dictyobacter vulcani TaxID=2607529 RepID=A0A5J4KLC0_9CHLR|nr:hypothetical protein KDW_20440 [Dictyobacter vulcani]